MIKKFAVLWKEAIAMVNDNFKSHYEDYDESVERDFCDALISAKNKAHNKALKDGKEVSPHLTDANLAITTLDALFAGTDTALHTFEWMLLFLAYYPEVQTKLREEIEGQIGDRTPTHEDRKDCHYVMSFISEILRLRNVVVGGLPHSTLSSSKLHEYSIPAGTTVMVYQGCIMTNEKHWSKGNQFIPERFLENGKYKTTQNKAYIPFGVGPRICPGEKVALAELYFALVRFLQMTADYDIGLGSNHGIEPDPNLMHLLLCQDFKIILNTK